ncbi:MAG: hypothetical protein ACI9QN_002702, partial [Arcticibacterium sp.]
MDMKRLTLILLVLLTLPSYGQLTAKDIVAK